MIDATYTGVLKPDPRAFELVGEALDLPLNQCLFIDDQLKNIEGAAALNMPYVHFDVTNPATSYAQVRSTYV